MLLARVQIHVPYLYLFYITILIVIVNYFTDVLKLVQNACNQLSMSCLC